MKSNLYWTLSDFQQGHCDVSKIGLLRSPEVWTNDDFLQGRCSHKVIGQLKSVGYGHSPSPDARSPSSVDDARSPSSDELVASLPPATMAEFKQAVLQHARGLYGSYEGFLRAYPDFTKKFLLAMVKEPAVTANTPLQVIVSWISPDRFAYKHADTSPPPVEMVTDAVVRETPWKSKLDTSENRLVDDIEKLSK